MRKILYLMLLLFVVSGCSSPANLQGNVEVGNTITFGKYEQDNDSSNGQENIEWIVLDKEDNKILVVSKYALETRSFHPVNNDVTWEGCSLRKWLNSMFLNKAFDENERKSILTTTVNAEKNPRFDSEPGNDTKDKIFLLSVSEVESYFPNDDDRVVKASVYAMNNVGYVNEDVNWSWWLRTPGSRGRFVSFVNVDGSIYLEGTDVVSINFMVRPAMWLEI